MRRDAIGESERIDLKLAPPAGEEPLLRRVRPTKLHSLSTDYMVGCSRLNWGPKYYGYMYIIFVFSYLNNWMSCLQNEMLTSRFTGLTRHVVVDAEKDSLL